MKTFFIVLLVIHIILIIVELLTRVAVKHKSMVRMSRFLLMQLIPIMGPAIGTLVILYLHIEGTEMPRSEKKEE